MVDLLTLPVRNDNGDVHVVIETTRGSAAKLAYDPDLQVFTLSKALILGLTYPYDWGFIPSTRGDDGDPIDALVLHDAATAPGLVLQCKIIGVLQVQQSERHRKPIRNDRLIAVPRHSHREKADKDARDLPTPMRQEIEKFFVAADELESKELKFLGWKGPKAGERLIDQAAKDFKKAAGRA
ncbi:MAG: inorganic pyrophosphatase [Proteobacteria bacterium]|nr:MAG: inorganic pyrophosphatase [Pseudomonadota bacterium]